MSEVGQLQLVTTCRPDHQGLHWSASTHELLFTRGTELVAASYSDRDGRFTVQRERIVARVAADDRFYGVAPDGQRFLIGTRVRPAAGASGIRVEVNGLAAMMTTAAR
jgi:hypothetical protein